jgi:hypothetical protein
VGKFFLLELDKKLSEVQIPGFQRMSDRRFGVREPRGIENENLDVWCLVFRLTAAIVGELEIGPKHNVLRWDQPAIVKQ